MSQLIDALRDARFLTPERARGYAVLLLAGAVFGIALILWGRVGMLDADGRPIGSDFANVYAAGTMALEGRPTEAWDWPAHHEVQKRISGSGTVPFYGWHYPPFFLALAAALAVLPYLGAVAVWQIATLIPYLMGLRRIADRPEAWLMGLAFPAVFVNLTHGHNGFLTAALLGGALLVLDRRPILAGVLVGLLAYKPQFGLLIPLVLMATGRWATFASASATVLAMAAAATLLFGPAVWPAFIASLEPTKTIVLEMGDTGFHKIQSVFAAVRLWGGGVGLAHAAQWTVTAGLAVVLVALWRSSAAHELKAAALALACLLATPYSLDYDLIVVGVALAFLARHAATHGLAPWQGAIMTLAFFAPILSRPVANLIGLPLGVLSVAALLAMTVALAREAPVTATARA
jgi:hypothetical protein